MAKNKKIGRFLSVIILLIFSIFTLAPILGILLVAVFPRGQPISSHIIPSQVHLHNFRDAWFQANLDVYIKPSIIVSVSVIVIVVILSIQAGYAISLHEIKGKKCILLILLIGLVIPSEVMIIPLYYELQKLNLTNSYIGLILPQIALSLPFGTLWMRAFFLSFPVNLIEAAKLDGATTFQVIRKIVIPNAIPSIVTLILLQFIWTWNEFLIPLVMVSNEKLRTAPLGLSFFIGMRRTDFPGLSAASLLIAFPPLLLFILLNGLLMKSILADSTA